MTYLLLALLMVMRSVPDESSAALSLPNLLASVAVVFLLVSVGAFLPGALATHKPADKVAASGSSMEIMTVPLVEGSHSEVHTLFTSTLKSSSTSDLILSVTLECALWTDTTVIGNSASEAIANVDIWIELDGVPVPVSSDDTTETGRVTFCNRAFKMETLNFDDEDQRIDTFVATRNANAFNWVTLDVGSGLHTIEVKAQLDAEVNGVGMAKAAIGKRTLVVEPGRFANDATI